MFSHTPVWYQTISLGSLHDGQGCDKELCLLFLLQGLVHLQLLSVISLTSESLISFLEPRIQKKIFMVLIQQCCSWSEWLYLECSAIPGMTRCNLYDQCVFSRPSLDWYNCDSSWEMESTSNIKILDPLPIHTTSSFLAGHTSLFQLFIRGLSSSDFEKDLQTSRGVKHLITVDVHTCLSEWNPHRKLE